MNSKRFTPGWLLVAFCIILAATAVKAQPACPLFWSDIQKFKKADSVQFPPPHSILFVGSSSFTFWKDLAADFPGYPVINRAFGGSQLTDVIRYAYDIILSYAPRQVVIYCGENDLAAAPALPAEAVALRLKTLFGIIRQNLPDAAIAFVSIKPSPSRAALFPKVREANAAIRTFLEKQQNASFIDVYTAMLDESGNPKVGIFLSDKLHMNENGYRIWQQIIQPICVADEFWCAATF